MGRKSVTKTRIDDQGRKNEWVAILFPIFQARGLKGFRMQDWADMLGVSKATLYKYFASRDELLAYMMDWKLAQIQGFQSRLTDPDLPYLDRFAEALKIASMHMTGLSNRFLADLKEVHPEVWQRVEQFIQAAIQILSKFYEEGKQHGAFTDIHTAVLTATDQLMMMQLTDFEFLERHQLKVHEAMESYFLMKFSGIIRRDKVEPQRLQAILEDLVANLKRMEGEP